MHTAGSCIPRCKSNAYSTLRGSYLISLRVIMDAREDYDNVNQ